MSKNVLVTGVGGGSGAYTARILKASGYNVVGTDASGFAFGSVLCNHFCVVSCAADRNQFVRDIKRLMGRFEISVVLPNVDDELQAFADEFDRRDVIISPSPTISICLDKYLTYKEYVGKVKVPATCLMQHRDDWFGFIGGVVAKPRMGRGSKGVYTFDGPSEVAQCWPLFKNGDYVVQEWINGDEYTVDCLVMLNGDHLVYPRRRLRTHGGISQVGQLVMDKDIIEAARKVISRLEFRGPINIQFIKNQNGVYLIEINPRLSGGIGITYAAGVNLPDLAIKAHFGEWESFGRFPDASDKIIFRYLVEETDESKNRDSRRL